MRLHKQIYEVRDELLGQLLALKTDLIFDAKNTLFTHEQKILSTIQLQEKEIEHIQTHLFQQRTATHLFDRKLQFWIGYVGFIGINFLIL